MKDIVLLWSLALVVAAGWGVYALFSFAVQATALTH